jgi:hypothetical protein
VSADETKPLFQDTRLKVSRKAQYEKKFKEWGFQKNRTKDDWKAVSQKVGLRKRTAKESNVYIDGELMPRKKLQKEISRQGFMTFAEQFNQAQGELLKASKRRLLFDRHHRNTSSNTSWIRYTHSNRPTSISTGL